MPEGLESSRPLGFFGRRRGKRLRSLAADRLEAMLPSLAIPVSAPIADPGRLFSVPVSRVWLEVGFGSGEHTAAQLCAFDDVGILASEPYVNGVSVFLAHLSRDGTAGRTRILADDVRLLLPLLPDGCLERVFVLFPDPWPKARHAKRRFIGPDNLAVLARVLADGGELRVASDDPVYQAWTEEHLGAHPAFERIQMTDDRSTLPDDWFPTRYERKCIAGQPRFYRFSRIIR